MWSLLQIELFKISKKPRTYIAFISIAAIVAIFQLAFKADGGSYLDMNAMYVRGFLDILNNSICKRLHMCIVVGK